MATGPKGNQGRLRFGPSDRLMTMFRSCSTDPTNSIETRLRSMLHIFVQHQRDNAGEENTNLAVKCCPEAQVLYYRILEKLVIHEMKRRDGTDILVLSGNDLLQRCLVAFCLEITIFSNHFPCDFPLILQILNLAPYNFLKVIELVLRAVGLPHTVFSHLAQVEEKVLECLAWTSDSPLWEQIRANKGRLPTCQQAMPPEQLEDTERTQLEPDRDQSEVDLNLGAEASASTDQQRSQSAASRPHRSNPIQLFARKVYSLMGRRLTELCSKLGISKELRLKIWTCFEHSLVHCTDLMVDRHLDQLLMCAIYIIAKITKLEIPFKRIMKCYNSQPLASKNLEKNNLVDTQPQPIPNQSALDVCKNVLIFGRYTENSLTGNNNNGDHGVSIPTPNTPSAHYPGPRQEERGNLIHFYNQIYSTRMQHFAKQFAPTSGGDTPPLSPYPQRRNTSSLRLQLLSRCSITISPLNTQTTSLQPSGLDYTFNSSPSERLREINNMIRTGRTPNRGRYELSLDREEQERGEEDKEDGPPARRRRLDDESALERRLRIVVNDRVTRRDQDQTSPVTRPNLH